MLEEIYNTDTPLLSYRKGRSLKDLLVRAKLLKVIFLPRPIGAVYMFGLSSHHHFTFNGLGKPVVTVRDFTKFRIPPPLSFELEKISRIFPYPRAENLIHLLVFPTYSPGWPGVLPLGEADDMCIKTCKTIVFCVFFKENVNNKYYKKKLMDNRSKRSFK